jgi:signal transduction histidine kinase
MRRPTSEWLLLPLAALPLAVGIALSLLAREEHRRALADAVAEGEAGVRRRLGATDEDAEWWWGRFATATGMEGRVDPQRGDVPFALPEGPLTASVRGLDVPEGARDVWILGAPRPGGLSAEALANGEVRLRVERGLPPAVLSVDPGARSLATLLADAPDPDALRRARLPAATKRFVASRWCESDPALAALDRLTALLERLETWWRGNPGPGLHELESLDVVVSPRRVEVVAHATESRRPRPFRVSRPVDERFRIDYVVGEDRADRPPERGRILWEGPLDSPLVGTWRLVAVHGDAWWRGPPFATYAWPGGAAVAVLTVLPLQLLLSLRRRRRQEEARRRFLTELAHDLRTPLTSLRLYAEMLEAGRVGDEARDEYVGVIARESARLSSLLANLLDLTRLERGVRALEPREVDVGESVASAVRDLAAVAPERAEDVTVDGPAGTRAIVDPTALGRSLANLLENAAKFTDPGTAVRVTWRAVDGSVLLRVEDQGPGVPEAERERLFERFTRGKAAERDGVPGTGLGLALVRELIVGCGGTVRLDAGAEGAAFELRLRGASDV